MTAPATPVTVGVDTHLDLHVAAVVDQTGRLPSTQGFAASTRGDVALVAWAERFGPVERIGVEGTGTETREGQVEMIRVPRGRHRRAVAGHRRRHSPAAPREAVLRPPVRGVTDPGILGRTHRHRLNRGGDRQANHASWRIALVRMRCHPPTRAYVAAAHQPRPVQARHHALVEALHPPRGLLPPSPASTPPPRPLARNRRHQLPQQHGHDGAGRWHASLPTPSRIARRAGY